ncbi:carbon storage regulator CsrA [Paenibacillus aquistagni]|uniref:carbon storage regulator CsrA n=1 Tax=Paenibacillus aquistagni TaxID=1852522 RepID=UPI00145BE713|nr:carbon storage regulator CsrA [Paenibacillus aquistagni]NMM54310.1 carbon storage regulator CsrA [Paenibacillus aquistagni]
MLVLKRKVGEKIMLGDDIEVVVLAVEGEFVKLGFEAPKHIQIMRKELYEDIAEENSASGKTLSAQEGISELLRQFKKS